MASIDRVVVVGGGLGGGAAARELRSAGFDGQITLVGAERHPPYERPPLSKEYLRGESASADAYVEPEQYWEQQGVELLPVRSATGIDAAAGRLDLDDGTELPFDRLVLAPGAEPRTLAVPGNHLDGVVTLRTLEDADLIRSLASRASRVLVVGAGWIGCEVSASLRALGCEATLVLPARVPLERTLGPEIAAIYARMHTDNGVDLRPNTSIVAFEVAGGLRGARTDSGDLLDCELAVVAVGVRPRVELAVAAGLAVGDGVIVDGSLTTSDPRIFAVGDVAFAPSPLLNRSLRVEHWGTALAQGRHAARCLLGLTTPYDAIPYFFSDQYDTGMEFWGDPARPGELVIRGELEHHSFNAFWHRRGRVTAVMNMHVHRHHAAGDAEHDHEHPEGAPGPVAHSGGHLHAEDVERLLRSTDVDVSALHDPAVPLNDLIGSKR